MSLLSRMKSVFAKTSEPAVPPPLPRWEMSEAVFAMLPFELARKHEHPFDTWDASRGYVPPGMELFWSGILLQYLFFSFYVYTSVTWGNEFSERILQHQVDRLNEGDPGWGDNHLGGIRKFYDIAKEAQEKPVIVEGKNGKDLEMPLDYHVAVTVLVTGKGSLFAYDPEHPDRRPEIPNDLDWKLTFDLEAARNKAMDHWKPLGAIVTFVPAD